MAKPYQRKTVKIEDLKKILDSNRLKKQAIGLYGNVYSYPNFGNFRNRIYLETDTEIGLDSMSRALLLRWSREINAQTGFVNAAVRILAQYATGGGYDPEYIGNDPEWGKLATHWLLEQFYPQCCTRGLSFKEVMFLESTLMDIDGDLLCIYGKTSNGFPRFQLIPSHRIATKTTDNSIYEMGGVQCVDADGVVYEAATGRAVGYKVLNTSNLVNTIGSQVKELFISARDAHLIYEPRFIDKGRGLPSIAPAILQALSLLEIEQYQLQREKITSTVSLIEKNQSGQAPIELEQTLQSLNESNVSFGLMAPSPNVHAVDIFQGNELRYIKSTDGSDIKSMVSTNPSNETQAFVTRLETAVLSTLGVPHQLLFSPSTVSGRISDGVVDMFNATIKRRQTVLDKHARFIIGWALANAMETGILPMNERDNVFDAFIMTHPPKASLNEGYDRAADIADYSAGIKSLNDIAKKSKHTASDLIAEREKESIMFFQSAQRIAKETGVDLNIVIQSLRESLQIKTTVTEKSGDSVNEETPKAPFNG